MIHQITNIPLYYGAPCGTIDDILNDNTHDYLPVPEHLCFGRKLYAVQVVGDSMTGANIESGDSVVVDATEIPPERAVGRIVVASVDGKSTVKRLRISDDGYILQPENPKFKAYHVKEYENFRIMGVVIAVQKNIE